MSKKYHREYYRSHYKQIGKPCVVCGYTETYDVHHEGEERKEFILCPNCHALVTRKIKTLSELVIKPPINWDETKEQYLACFPRA